MQKLKAACKNEHKILIMRLPGLYLKYSIRYATFLGKNASYVYQISYLARKALNSVDLKCGTSFLY